MRQTLYGFINWQKYVEILLKNLYIYEISIYVFKYKSVFIRNEKIRKIKSILNMVVTFEVTKFYRTKIYNKILVYIKGCDSLNILLPWLKCFLLNNCFHSLSDYFTLTILALHFSIYFSLWRTLYNVNIVKWRIKFVKLNLSFNNL